MTCLLIENITKIRRGKKGSYSDSKTRNQDDDGTDVAFLTPTCYKQAYYKKDILFQKNKICIEIAFLLHLIFRTVYQP